MDGSGSPAGRCGYRTERSGSRLRRLGLSRPTTIPTTRSSALAASCQNGNSRFCSQANLVPDGKRPVSKNRLKAVRGMRSGTTTVSWRIRSSTELPGRWRYQCHANWMKRVWSDCGPSQEPWRCRANGPARSPVIHFTADRIEQLTVKRIVLHAGRSHCQVPCQLPNQAVRERRRGRSSEVER